MKPENEMNDEEYAVFHAQKTAETEVWRQRVTELAKQMKALQDEFEAAGAWTFKITPEERELFGEVCLSNFYWTPSSMRC